MVFVFVRLFVRWFVRLIARSTTIPSSRSSAFEVMCVCVVRGAGSAESLRTWPGWRWWWPRVALYPDRQIDGFAVSRGVVTFKMHDRDLRCPLCSLQPFPQIQFITLNSVAVLLLSYPGGPFFAALESPPQVMKSGQSFGKGKRSIFHQSLHSSSGPSTMPF